MRLHSRTKACLCKTRRSAIYLAGRLLFWGDRMSTCVLYVDESGDVRKHDLPLRNGQTPVFTLSGMALALAHWKDIDREFLALKRQFFQPEIDRSRKRAEHYEIK